MIFAITELFFTPVWFRRREAEAATLSWRSHFQSALHIPLFIKDKAFLPKVPLCNTLSATDSICNTTGEKRNGEGEAGNSFGCDIGDICYRLKNGGWGR